MPMTEHPHVSIDKDLIGYTDWWLDASARAGRPIAGWVTLIKRLRAAAVAESATSTEGPLARGLREDGQWDPRTVIDAGGNRGR